MNSQKLENKSSKFIIYDQCQEVLLLKSVQGFVSKDHVARVVSEIIDHLDIGCIAETYDHLGAPAYHPPYEHQRRKRPQTGRVKS